MGRHLIYIITISFFLFGVSLAQPSSGHKHYLKTIQVGKKVEVYSQSGGERSIGQSKEIWGPEKLFIVHSEVNENGANWLLVSYKTANGKTKFGWIDKSATSLAAPTWLGKDSLCEDPPVDVVTPGGERCSKGRLHLHNKIAKKLKQECIQRSAMDPNCDGQNDKTNLKDISKAIEKKYDEIPLQCIAASLHWGRNLRPNSRWSCDKWNGSRQKRAKPQCMTTKVARYLHWMENKALRCVNSGSRVGHQLVDPYEIFAITNHESRYNTDIAYTGGVGLKALTTSGADDVSKPYGASKKYWDSIKHNPECADFRESMEKPLLHFRNNIRHCQFIEPDIGTKRSMMFSLSLYRFYLENATKLVDQSRFSSKVEWEQAVKNTARLSYNRGPGAIRAAYKSLNKNRKNMNAAEFTDEMERLIGLSSNEKNFSYSSKVDQDFAHVNFYILYDREQKKMNHFINQKLGRELSSKELDRIFTIVQITRRSNSQARIAREKAAIGRIFKADMQTIDEIWERVNKVHDFRKKYYSAPTKTLRDDFGELPCPLGS